MFKSRELAAQKTAELTHAEHLRDFGRVHLFHPFEVGWFDNFWPGVTVSFRANECVH